LIRVEDNKGEDDGDQNPLFHVWLSSFLGVRRYGVKAMTAKRVTAREARGGQHGPANDTEPLYGLCRVVRARRQVPAGPGKHWRNKDFVHAYQRQGEPLRDGQLTATLGRTAGLRSV
jgi:hypothetical protein